MLRGIGTSKGIGIGKALIIHKCKNAVSRDYERFGALHEYYLPDNGEPVLNKGFQNWNLLVLNMAAWLDGKPFVTEF